MTRVQGMPGKRRESLRMRVVEILIGFFIAATIGLTSVGGGVLTVPILILFLEVPTAQAVGTALAFSALVKLYLTGLTAAQVVGTDLLFGLALGRGGEVSTSASATGTAPSSLG